MSRIDDLVDIFRSVPSYERNKSFAKKLRNSGYSLQENELFKYMSVDFRGLDQGITVHFYYKDNEEESTVTFQYFALVSAFEEKYHDIIYSNGFTAETIKQMNAVSALLSKTDALENFILHALENDSNLVYSKVNAEHSANMIYSLMLLLQDQVTSALDADDTIDRKKFAPISFTEE